jgi:hypothetical protein
MGDVDLRWDTELAYPADVVARGVVHALGMISMPMWQRSHDVTIEEEQVCYRHERTVARVVMHKEVMLIEEPFAAFELAL